MDTQEAYERIRNNPGIPTFQINHLCQFIIAPWGSLLYEDEHGRAWEIDKDKVSQLLTWLTDNHHIQDE